jgi:hypothetical protein
MLKRPWIAPVLLAAMAAGCGGNGAGTTKTHAATSPPPSASVTTTTAGSGPADCNALGINPQGMREGTCTHAGITWTIVDEDHTLKLKTLWGRVTGVRSAKTVTGASAGTTANGDFVIPSVVITNKLQSPQTFDGSGSQQAGLILDGAVFREAVSAEQADARSCQTRGKQIPPGQGVTCDVIFDVPAHAAGDLGKHGSGDLYLVNFGSDLAGSVLPQTIGQIRLYH